MKQIRMGPNNERLLGELVSDLFAVDDWEIEDRAGPRHFRGRLIGLGSSQRRDHNHGIYLAEGGQARCTACRWSEIYIFQVTNSTEHGPFSQFKYCVYTLGPSIVAGENTRANVRWAVSAFEVVELCTVRRGDRGRAFLPASSARALAMAAEVDDDITDAYVNRAVA